MEPGDAAGEAAGDGPTDGAGVGDGEEGGEVGEELGDAVADEDDPIAVVYGRIDAEEVSEDEFRDAVEAKVEQMGGLCDAATAAKLVAHELGEQRVHDVGDITPEFEKVQFVAKVVDVGERREFERDDGEDGLVANVEVADATGRVRVALWDEYADQVDELSEGDVLKIAGQPREGYRGGVEVSAHQVEVDEDAEVEVSDDASAIEEVEAGMEAVGIRGVVLATQRVNTFERDDGSEGQVANLVVGDETDWIRVALWDDRAELVEEVARGDVVAIRGGYARERQGGLEVNVGDRGDVERLDGGDAEGDGEDAPDVTFEVDATPIDDALLDESVDLRGVVTDVGETRTFDRDDGSTGKVTNIRIKDDSGELRVALWGEHADRRFGPGDEVQLTDVAIEEGWNDAVEGSVNWRSTVTRVGDAIGDDPERPAPASGGGGAGGDGAGGEDRDEDGLDSFT